MEITNPISKRVIFYLEYVDFIEFIRLTRAECRIWSRRAQDRNLLFFDISFKISSINRLTEKARFGQKKFHNKVREIYTVDYPADDILTTSGDESMHSRANLIKSPPAKKRQRSVELISHLSEPSRLVLELDITGGDGRLGTNSDDGKK